MELHKIYNPVASATNVENQNGGIVSPGQDAASGMVPSSSIQTPDNTNGSNAPVTQNAGQPLVVVQGKSISGTFKAANNVVSMTINNPA